MSCAMYIKPGIFIYTMGLCTGWKRITPCDHFKWFVCCSATVLLGNERVDIFYGVANPSIEYTICRVRVRAEYHLFACKNLVLACVPLLTGADISEGSRQPPIDVSVHTVQYLEY